jgi:hypothetical protein
MRQDPATGEQRLDAARSWIVELYERSGRPEQAAAYTEEERGYP